MNLVVSLLFLLLTVSATDKQLCLFEDPITDSCLTSFEVSQVNAQALPSMCIIATERNLLDKAEEFCSVASRSDEDSGYYYFKVLLLQFRLEQALIFQYSLFFLSPFNHNDQLNSILSNTTMFPSMQSLDDYQKSIYFFYTNKTQESLRHLNNHLKEHKTHKHLIYPHLLMARLQQKTQQYYDALNYMNIVIKENKQLHPYFYHLKGNFLMHHVQFKQAIVQFKRANLMFQQTMPHGFSFTHYNAGLSQQKLGNVEEAIKHYEKSYLSYHSAQALNALGHASFSLFQSTNNTHHLQVAQKYYKKALDKNAKYTVLIFNMGILKISQNKIEQAIDFFNKCLQMQKNFQSCTFGLIKSYYLNNQIQMAKELIDSLQKTEPVLTDLLGILYELGYHNKALQLVKDKVDFKSSDLLQIKGFNEFSANQFQQAEKTFKMAIQKGDKSPFVYDALGQTQFLLRKYQDCVISLQTAMKLDPRQQTKQQLKECKKHIESDQL